MLSFRLLPPLSPALRTRRLLAFALRDLHHLAVDSLPPKLRGLGGPHVQPAGGIAGYGRAIAARPTPAAPSVGNEIMQLQRISPLLGLDPELDAALAAVRTATAPRRSHGSPGSTTASPLCLIPSHGRTPRFARASILVLSEALAEHAAYFDAGAPA